MTKRRPTSEIIPLRRIGSGKERALSAEGAAECSPGRKPGVTNHFFDGSARECGRQKDARTKSGAGQRARSISVAPSGLTAPKAISPPGLRPGLYSAARLRGLVEAFLPTRQRFLRSLNTFAIFIAVVGIVCSTLQLNVMAEKNTEMKLADTNAVLLPNRSPLVSFRILFMTGSAADPQDKEGLASLTAAMLAEGGSRAKTYSEITDAMYPMATSFSWQVDKEMTVFSGTTHVDNLDKYYQLIREMLLDPGFREDDFTRLKEDAINYLKTSLRGGNDEELGKEVLYTMIYPKNHPYGHQNRGSVSALEKMTLKDVRDFYQANYPRANLVIGLAGGYPENFPKQVDSDFAKLPTGPNPDPRILRRFGVGQLRLKAAQPKLEPGTKIEIVQRETRSTAISLGFPIGITRADKDWPALAVVAAYFGQHRSSNSYLYQRLREARGLNYGDYAYVEYFPRGMFQFQPDPNLGRAQQIFQIWIRPVEPANGHFVLRAALYEYEKLVRDGMSKETFETTREFLSKYANVLTATQDAQLGYALDSRYYHITDFPGFMRAQLAKLTLAEVNRAIRQYLKSDTMRIAIVTKDAAGLRDAILTNKLSPIAYNAPKPKEITDEDKMIEGYKIFVKPGDVVIVPVEKMFQ
jgi:zinc protease